MEGVLWKWTNYLSGWQPRWFVLESGVLSYYKSQEDVNNGCKGSIKINACDIKVHPTDNTRLDLIIPGEQHYYVKAAQAQERQSWLIALGSAKAKYSQPSAQEAPMPGGERSTDIMRTKKSELRLYCDLLMQQVHSVKQSITQKEEGQESPAVPNIEKLNEATSLLSATCDTFIHTLEDVMKLMQDTPSPVEGIPTSPKRLSTSCANSRISVSRSNSSDKSVRTRQSLGSVDGANLVKSRRRSRASSEGSHSDVSLSEPTSTTLSISQTSMSKDSGATPESSISENSVVEEVGPRGNRERTKTDDGDEFKDAIDSRTPTFFSSMSTSFVHVRASEEEGVPVQQFLDACRELVPIFDKLNSTAFAPVKMDFSGNIRKIQQKQSSAIAAGSSGYPSLQAMVLSEVSNRQHTNSNSATVALRWLKRGLEFIREFLREVCSGGPDLAECASNAYSRTLKNYHGWVVRGVFAVAVKALPYRSEFLSHLAVGPFDSNSQQYLQFLMEDMEVFLQHLNSVILVINTFYNQQQLDVHEQV